MKTLFKIQLIALGLLLSVSLNAQKFHYGLKAGTNFAVQSEIASYYDNSDIRVGFNGGVFGNMAVTDYFLLQTEIIYDQKGSKKDNQTFKYDYLTVPVLSKFYIGNTNPEKLRFNMHLGPYTSMLLNAELDSDEITKDLSDDTEDFEFGAIAGMGISYPLAGNQLVVDLRLSLGLTEYDKTDSDPRNKYIGITVGYEF